MVFYTSSSMGGCMCMCVYVLNKEVMLKLCAEVNIFYSYTLTFLISSIPF